MTRIVAGTARGRNLRIPAGNITRPTSDRVREALFSSLDSLLGGFAGLRVLDLYAGSGAIGLEALSRGAEAVTLIESNLRAVRTIEVNVRAVGIAGANVVHGTVERVLREERPDEPFHLVVADPPYSLEEERLRAVVARLTDGWLAPDAVVVVERDRRSPPFQWPTGLTALRQRTYGETVLWYGRSAETD